MTSRAAIAKRTAEQSLAVDRFNALQRIGVNVVVYRTIDKRPDDVAHRTTTRSQAFLDSSGHAVVFLTGVAGYWSLDAIEVVGA
jgi:hypothetical protein